MSCRSAILFFTANEWAAICAADCDRRTKAIDAALITVSVAKPRMRKIDCAGIQERVALLISCCTREPTPKSTHACGTAVSRFDRPYNGMRVRQVTRSRDLPKLFVDRAYNITDILCATVNSARAGDARAQMMAVFSTNRLETRHRTLNSPAP